MTTFVVTGADLHAAAAWASRIVPNRPAMPLLGGLLLESDDETNGGELRLSAFDFDTSASVSVRAVVKEPGRALLSARLLVDVAKTVARDVDVTIETGPGGAEVRCGRAEWSVPVLPVEDYPQLPKGSDVLATVDADALRTSLARVLPAASREANKDLENLRGVRLEVADGVLTLVATDRYRLATADISLAGRAGDLPDALVPADLLDAAARAMHSGSVSLSCTDTTFGLATETHRLIGRQIAAEFPRWRGFTPDPAGHHVVVDSAELGQAIEQARVMSVADESANVLLRFDPDDGIEVSADDGNRKARAQIGVHSMAGEAMEGKFRPAYLRDALNGVGTSTVRLELHARRSLAVMVPCADDGTTTPGYRHLVMMTKGIRT